VIAVTAAVAASLGYIASRRKEPSEAQVVPVKPPAKNVKESPKTAPKPASDPLLELGLALGEVVSAEGEERWLTGVIVARDRGQTAAAVFIAPEGIEHRAVFAFPPPERAIFWLAPVEVTSSPEPPATLEIGGMVMRRKRRLPVSFERLGQGAPRMGSEGIFAMYETGGREVAAVITSEGQVFAWSGRRLEEGEFDRMGRVHEDEVA
jgi:hypothetical protein